MERPRGDACADADAAPLVMSFARAIDTMSGSCNNNDPCQVWVSIAGY
jgi:hypothetical protein